MGQCGLFDCPYACIGCTSGTSHKYEDESEPTSGLDACWCCSDSSFFPSFCVVVVPLLTTSTASRSGPRCRRQRRLHLLIWAGIVSGVTGISQRNLRISANLNSIIGTKYGTGSTLQGRTVSEWGRPKFMVIIVNELWGTAL